MGLRSLDRKMESTYLYILSLVWCSCFHVAKTESKFFSLIMIILAKREFTDWFIHQHALVMCSIPPLSSESNTAFSSRSSFESDVPGDNRVYCFMNPYISSKGKATVKALRGNRILLWGQSWNFREKGMLYCLNFCTVSEMGIGWMSYREMKL